MLAMIVSRNGSPFRWGSGKSATRDPPGARLSTAPSPIAGHCFVEGPLPELPRRVEPRPWPPADRRTRKTRVPSGIVGFTIGHGGDWACPRRAPVRGRSTTGLNDRPGRRANGGGAFADGRHLGRPSAGRGIDRRQYRDTAAVTALWEEGLAFETARRPWRRARPQRSTGQSGTRSGSSRQDLRAEC